MPIKINLSNHADKFEDDAFIISQEINFIFGRNGSGKTTIADEIEKQLSGSYDVCVYKDFDGVVQNERLDAISLGVENAEIQIKVNAIDKEISEIVKQCEQPSESGARNLYTKAHIAQLAYNVAEKDITEFYSKSAKYIKGQTSPHISVPNYNRTNFIKEIPNALLLSENEIFDYKSMIKSEKKSYIELIIFPKIDLSIYIRSVNEILLTRIIQPKVIPELCNNKEKQIFAGEGMRIHADKIGEVCSFCGNEISPERWQILGKYFNDEVKKLEGRINKGMEVISKVIEEIQNISELKESDFYEKYFHEVQKLNLQLKSKKADYKDFLETLKSSLIEKKENIFSESEVLKIAIPEDFTNFRQSVDSLVRSNNLLSDKLTDEQEKAKNALRYHEIKKLLDSPKYDEFLFKSGKLKDELENANKLLLDKKEELSAKKNERRALILQTRNEEKIAEKINKLLENNGIFSFTLKLVEGDAENQKGQYRIKGHDEKIRNITQLSKGEKNIIAFLYFIFALDDANRLSSPKIIVFDDPMTSNDEFMQTLMLGEIQKLYQRLSSDSFMFILTHNKNFHINVSTGFHDAHGMWHLISDGKKTKIQPFL
ncbi:MAG: AAA family ATPase [Defluviitaleaceae bacterium]|nr:AAA family ATPase [Defluviitaleaceae bacterium]